MGRWPARPISVSQAPTRELCRPAAALHLSRLQRASTMSLASSAEEAPPFSLQLLPKSFLVMKKEFSLLSGHRTLMLCFLALGLLSMASFGGLFFFFFVQDTTTETRTSTERLDVTKPNEDWSCALLSAVPPRGVRYPCLLRDDDGQLQETSCSGTGFSNNNNFVFPNRRPALFDLGAAKLARSTSDLSPPTPLEPRTDVTGINVQYHDSVYYESHDDCLADTAFAEKYCGASVAGQSSLTPARVARFYSGWVEFRPVVGPGDIVYFASRDHNLYGVNTRTGSLAWAAPYKTEGQLWHSPAVGPDGTVYVGGEDKHLHAVNGKTGEKKWDPYQTSGHINTQPTISLSGDLVYVGSDDDHLHAVRTADGTREWVFKTAGNVRTAPAVAADGTLYVCSYDGHLYAVDASLGTEKWRWEMPGSNKDLDVSPVIGPSGIIYVADGTSVLRAIRDVRPSAVEVWNISLGERVVGKVALNHNSTALYVCSGDDGHLYKLDPDTGATLWKYKAGGLLNVLPAVGFDGTVYTTGFGGILHAVDAASGELKWTHEADGPLSAPAVGVDGTIFVGTTHGLHIISGSIVIRPGRFNTNGIIRSSAALSPDKTTAYICNHARKMYAVDVATGRTRWEPVPIKGYCEADVTVGPDNTVYVGTSGVGFGWFYAFDGATGAVKWKKPGIHAIRGAPVLDAKGTVYYGDDKGNIFALNGTTGQEARVLESAGTAVQSVVAFAADGSIYVHAGSINQLKKFSSTGNLDKAYKTGGGPSTPLVGADGTIFVGGKDSYLHAINNNTFDARWRYKTGDAVLSSPAFSKDETLVYVGSNDHNLHAVEVATGLARWTYVTGNNVESSPVVAPDGTVYVGSDDGKLHAVNGSTGRPLWVHVTGGAVKSSPVLGRDGTVYVGSDDGYLHFVRFEASQYQDCGVSQLQHPTATLVGVELYSAEAEGQCASSWQCANAPPDVLEVLQKAFCAGFANHPPYSCSRRVARSVLESISLAFSFAEMLYAVALFACCRVLWQIRRKHRVGSGVKIYATDTADGTAIPLDGFSTILPS